MQKNGTEKKVVSSSSYYSLFTAVATDNFLTDLIKTLLDTTFSKVATAEGQKRHQNQVLCAACDYGLVTNGSFFYTEKSSYKGFNKNM